MTFDSFGKLSTTAFALSPSRRASVIEAACTSAPIQTMVSSLIGRLLRLRLWPRVSADSRLSRARAQAAGRFILSEAKPKDLTTRCFRGAGSSPTAFRASASADGAHFSMTGLRGLQDDG